MNGFGVVGRGEYPSTTLKKSNLVQYLQVLSKDHHIVGCEAQWYHYEKSGLDQQIKQPYKDGLLIYDFLKAQTKKGHTGIRSSHVREKTQTLVSDYSEAISFLKRNKVVKEVTIEGVIWIFLYHLYKAEEFIASGVTCLFREQMENQWILDVDFDRFVFRIFQCIQ